jgi:uncharacterized membrane protein
MLMTAAPEDVSLAEAAIVNSDQKLATHLKVLSKTASTDHETPLVNAILITTAERIELTKTNGVTFGSGGKSLTARSLNSNLK